ncbi:uncharacterized protein LJ264_001085 [Porphyrio hochstetteri]
MQQILICISLGCKDSVRSALCCRDLERRKFCPGSPLKKTKPKQKKTHEKTNHSPSCPAVPVRLPLFGVAVLGPCRERASPISAGSGAQRGTGRDAGGSARRRAAEGGKRGGVLPPSRPHLGAPDSTFGGGRKDSACVCVSGVRSCGSRLQSHDSLRRVGASCASVRACVCVSVRVSVSPCASAGCLIAGSVAESSRSLSRCPVSRTR